MLGNLYYFFSKIYCIVRYNHIKIGCRARVRLPANFEGYNKICQGAFFKGNIGYGSYIGNNSVVVGNVGRFCSIADNVIFLTKTHPVHGFISTHPAFYSLKKQCGCTFVDEQLFDEEPQYIGENKSIIVGNDVYIGYGTIIIGPCKIGDGAVIAAGSVVTKDIEPYEIVGGNPAKFISLRFDKEIVRSLCEDIRWWEKDVKWIKENSQSFGSYEKLRDCLYSSTNKE